MSPSPVSPRQEMATSMWPTGPHSARSRSFHSLQIPSRGSRIFAIQHEKCLQIVMHHILTHDMAHTKDHAEPFTSQGMSCGPLTAQSRTEREIGPHRPTWSSQKPTSTSTHLHTVARHRTFPTRSLLPLALRRVVLQPQSWSVSRHTVRKEIGCGRKLVNAGVHRGRRKVELSATVQKQLVTKPFVSKNTYIKKKWLNNSGKQERLRVEGAKTAPALQRN